MDRRVQSNKILFKYPKNLDINIIKRKLKNVLGDDCKIKVEEKDADMNYFYVLLKQRRNITSAKHFII